MNTNQIKSVVVDLVVDDIHLSHQKDITYQQDGDIVFTEVIEHMTLSLMADRVHIYTWLEMTIHQNIPEEEHDYDIPLDEVEEWLLIYFGHYDDHDVDDHEYGC